MSRFKPETVEKNLSNKDPAAEIKHALLRCQCSALTTKQLTLFTRYGHEKAGFVQVLETLKSA